MPYYKFRTREIGLWYLRQVGFHVDHEILVFPDLIPPNYPTDCVMGSDLPRAVAQLDPNGELHILNADDPTLGVYRDRLTEGIPALVSPEKQAAGRVDMRRGFGQFLRSIIGTKIG